MEDTKKTTEWYDKKRALLTGYYSLVMITTNLQGNFFFLRKMKTINKKIYTCRP